MLKTCWFLYCFEPVGPSSDVKEGKKVQKRSPVMQGTGRPHKKTAREERYFCLKSKVGQGTNKKTRKHTNKIQKSIASIGRECVETELFKNCCFSYVKLRFFCWLEVACLSKGGRFCAPWELFAFSWARNRKMSGAKKRIRCPPKAHMGPSQK